MRGGQATRGQGIQHGHQLIDMNDAPVRTMGLAG